eukprot:TRINITY_DN38790_c0_g1_i1.p1 TRINITY_DN38790_c0_g1~~TRINITY_DN38790_c0_g1_i1.p1  ORF type:complete len:894 (-),score=163.14 TRINITY_DN38790_c0_g1_i1:115-2796(-)
MSPGAATSAAGSPSPPSQQQATGGGGGLPPLRLSADPRMSSQDLLPRLVAPPQNSLFATSSGGVSTATVSNNFTHREGGTIGSQARHSHPQLPLVDSGVATNRFEGALPPLRDSGAPSPPLGVVVASGSRAVASRRVSNDLDMSFDQPRVEGKMPAITTPGGRTTARLGQLDDSRATASEMENLKRQVNRLTQLRRERDTYIQDLLADAEAMQRRHEGELARRTARLQREVTDRVEAQKREHQQQLQELRRSNSSALAQQAAQHDLELTKLGDLDANKIVLERLHQGVESLAQALEARAAALECEAAAMETASPLRHRCDSRLSVLRTEVKTDEGLPRSTNVSSAEITLDAAQSALERLVAAEKLLLACANSGAYEKESEVNDLGLKQSPVIVQANLAEAVVARRKLCEQALISRLGRLRKDLCCLAALRSWALVTIESRQKLLHMSKLDEVTAEAAEELSRAKTIIDKRILDLKRQLQGVTMAACEGEGLRSQHVAFLRWKEVAYSSHFFRVHSRELSDCRRERTVLLVKEASKRVRHVALRVWKAEAAAERQNIAARLALKNAEITAAAEYATLQEECHFHDLERCRRLQAQGHRAGRTRAQAVLGKAFLCWRSALKEKQKESAHRYQLITSAAEASSELFKLRTEARTVATELRRQRRAHGVAAIHASLDRRMQAVVHAWALVAGETQREALYQRQLDIAAAESAANCAVLRMEGRRNSMDMREQRRMHGVRAIEASLRHWRHAILYAWSVVVAESQQEVSILQRFGRACDEAAVFRTRSERQITTWRDAHARAVWNLSISQLLCMAFAVWAKQTEARKRQELVDRYTRAAREAVCRIGEALMDAKACFDISSHMLIVFRTWQLTLLDVFRREQVVATTGDAKGNWSKRA